MTAPSVEQLRGYPVLVRQIDVRERTYELVGPANYEQLVDDPRVVARFAQDEFMPYWAEFWSATRSGKSARPRRTTWGCRTPAMMSRSRRIVRITSRTSAWRATSLPSSG